MQKTNEKTQIEKNKELLNSEQVNWYRKIINFFKKVLNDKHKMKTWKNEYFAEIEKLVEFFETDK